MTELYPIKIINRKPTRELVKADLRGVAAILKTDSFKVKDYVAAGGKYHPSTLGRVFGGWVEAMLAAGLKPMHVPVTKQGLMENFDYLVQCAKGKPNLDHFHQYHSKHAMSTYVRHFGIWENTLLTYMRWRLDIPTVNAEFRAEALAKAADKAVRAAGHRSRRTVRQADRLAVFEADRYTCQFCQTPSLDGTDLHVDHIIPAAKGGIDKLINYQTLCITCNQAKKAKLMKGPPQLAERHAAAKAACDAAALRASRGRGRPRSTVKGVNNRSAAEESGVAHAA